MNRLDSIDRLGNVDRLDTIDRLYKLTFSLSISDDSRVHFIQKSPLLYYYSHVMDNILSLTLPPFYRLSLLVQPCTLRQIK